MFEIAYESRKFNWTGDSISQTFTYHICYGDFLVDANVLDPIHGAFFTPNDDQAVVKYIYDTFPSTRTFAVPGGDLVILVLDQIDGVEQVDDGWEVTLTYTLPNGQKQLENYVQFGFSTNGGEVKMEKAISVKSRVARPGLGSPPETYGFLGISSKTIEGIMVPATQLTFNITGYFPPEVWGPSLLNLFTTLGRHYNASNFYGFPPGEILFEYAEGSGEAMKVVPVTFYFTHSPNINNVPDPPFSTGLTMLGHDYVQYLKGQTVSQNMTLLIPNFREVVQIREPGNLNLLGI